MTANRIEREGTLHRIPVSEALSHTGGDFFAPAASSGAEKFALSAFPGAGARAERRRDTLDTTRDSS